jgi:hypothetical protein
MLTIESAGTTGHRNHAPYLPFVAVPLVLASRERDRPEDNSGRSRSRLARGTPESSSRRQGPQERRQRKMRTSETHFTALSLMERRDRFA